MSKIKKDSIYFVILLILHVQTIDYNVDKNNFANNYLSRKILFRDQS